MLCLSDFELYSRWVPLTGALDQPLGLIIEQLLNSSNFNFYSPR